RPPRCPSPLARASPRRAPRGAGYPSPIDGAAVHRAYVPVPPPPYAFPLGPPVAESIASTRCLYGNVTYPPSSPGPSGRAPGEPPPSPPPCSPPPPPALSPLRPRPPPPAPHPPPPPCRLPPPPARTLRPGSCPVELQPGFHPLPERSGDPFPVW